jgi:hypothetical protein
VDSLIAAGVRVQALRSALEHFLPDIDDERLGVIDWVGPEDSTIAIDLLLPLMALSRDLAQLGEAIDEVVLDGA